MCVKEIANFKIYFIYREDFYVRNHLPVPEIDLENYTFEVSLEENTVKTLNLDDLKKYPKYTITSAVMCGGNRRSEMAQVIHYSSAIKVSTF